MWYHTRVLLIIANTELDSIHCWTNRSIPVDGFVIPGIDSLQKFPLLGTNSTIQSVGMPVCGVMVEVTRPQAFSRWSNIVRMCDMIIFFMGGRLISCIQPNPDFWPFQRHKNCVRLCDTQWDSNQTSSKLDM